MTFALFCVYLLAGALVARIAYVIQRSRRKELNEAIYALIVTFWPVMIPVLLALPLVVRWMDGLAERLAKWIEDRLNVGMDP